MRLDGRGVAIFIGYQRDTWKFQDELFITELGMKLPEEYRGFKRQRDMRKRVEIICQWERLVLALHSMMVGESKGMSYHEIMLSNKNSILTPIHGWIFSTVPLLYWFYWLLLKIISTSSTSTPLIRVESLCHKRLRSSTRHGGHWTPCIAITQRDHHWHLSPA